jgi:hypothetical protein
VSKAPIHFKMEKWHNISSNKWLEWTYPI